MNLRKKISKLIYPLVLIVLTFGILYQTYFLFNVTLSPGSNHSHNFPYQSFAFISIDLEINVSEVMGLSIPEGTREISSRGSGMVVGTTASGNSAVLTANHVCNPPPFTVSAWSSFMTKKIGVTDFNGNVYEATIVLTDIQNDLCLLEVEGFRDLGVPLSAEPSRPGEKVYSVASPMAFFSPGMVPLFEGYYSGDIFSSNGVDSIYTVPAREGSSGSAILNSSGEIVGVVHSSLTGFQHVAICSTRNQVEAFLVKWEYLTGGTLR